MASFTGARAGLMANIMAKGVFLSCKMELGGKAMYMPVQLSFDPAVSGLAVTGSTFTRHLEAYAYVKAGIDLRASLPHPVTGPLVGADAFAALVHKHVLGSDGRHEIKNLIYVGMQGRFALGALWMNLDLVDCAVVYRPLDDVIEVYGSAVGPGLAPSLPDIGGYGLNPGEVSALMSGAPVIRFEMKAADFPKLFRRVRLIRLPERGIRGSGPTPPKLER